MSYEQQREAICQKVSQVTAEDFESLALEIFRFQAVHNALYGQYLSLLHIDFQEVSSISQIPFLPVQFFKNYQIKTGQWKEEAIFTSSGTTGAATSRHFVRDLQFYKENTLKGFIPSYGAPEKFCIVALLPSYLERSGSSLVCMASHFIQLSADPRSGFFLNNEQDLLKVLAATGKPVLLLGVSFALLELAERHPVDLRQVIIMETGGMKGRRREWTWEELHEKLKEAFQVENIHSEYGMTELFSQAYAVSSGRFYPAPTLRALAREITDPLSLQAIGKTGVLNLIDLANFDTCSFIATEDLGRIWQDGSFEVLGRLDHSDVRGCNLLIENAG